MLLFYKIENFKNLFKIIIGIIIGVFFYFLKAKVPSGNHHEPHQYIFGEAF